MSNITIVIGALLTVLGIGSYMGATPPRSWTALIPSFVGIILILCGVMARKEQNRKTAMHVAAAVGLLGFLAAAGRLGMSLARGTEVNPRSAVPLFIMAILTLAFVILCVRSFIHARRQREAQQRGFEPTVPTR